MKIAKTKHFAKSLVEIGQEQNCFSALIDDLKSVNAKFDENLDLVKYLVNKQVVFAKKKEALKHVFQDFISEKTYNFIFLLIKSDKLKFLGQIIAQAEKMSLHDGKIIEVVIESASPLNAEQEKEICKIIEKKKGVAVVSRNKIDPKLLGGMKLIIGDTVIEGSLYGKIMRLKQKIEDLE